MNWTQGPRIEETKRISVVVGLNSNQVNLVGLNSNQVNFVGLNSNQVNFVGLNSNQVNFHNQWNFTQFLVELGKSAICSCVEATDQVFIFLSNSYEESSPSVQHHVVLEFGVTVLTCTRLYVWRLNIEFYFIAINIVITRKDVLNSELSNFIVLGLSDEIRSNFSIMKDLAQHTRISPAGRAKELESFMNDLQTNQEAQKEMSQWNLNFERTLLKMTGRTYPPESKSFVVG